MARDRESVWHVFTQSGAADTLRVRSSCPGGQKRAAAASSEPGLPATIEGEVMRRGWARAVVLAAVVTAGGVFAAPANAASTPPGHAGKPPEIAVGAVDRLKAEQARGYWTSARMATARPAQPASRPGRPSPGPEQPAPDGPRTEVEPAVGSEPARSDGISTMSSTTLGRPYTNLPDRLNVKVFFTKATGGNFVCSGTIANSASKRMVSTAGHCVSDGAGRWHRNVVVVPAYSSSCDGCGDRPYGTWTARQLTSRNAWHVDANLKQDVGYIIANDLNGQRIVNRLGGQGSTFNASRDQYFRAYGYPAGAPFNGFNQRMCGSSRTGNDNPNWFASGPNTLKITCNMTGGSSGGGWIINQSSGLGYINSVNSYKYDNDASSMYGPYFGNEAKSLFDHTVSLG